MIGKFDVCCNSATFPNFFPSESDLSFFNANEAYGWIDQLIYVGNNHA